MDPSSKIYINFLKKRLEKPKPQINEKEKKLRIRVHEIGFTNDLILGPSWLRGLTPNQKTKYNGINVKRNTRTKNNEQFFLYFDYTKFEGLMSIRITTSSVIYHFKRNKKDSQIPFDKGSYDWYIQHLQSQCILARNFLIKNYGFEIDGSPPVLWKSPSCALSLNGKTVFGTVINGCLELNDGKKIYFDDSPGLGEGEIEGSFDKLNEVFNIVPEKVKNLSDKINNNQQNIEKRLGNIENILLKQTNQFDKLIGLFETNLNKNQELPKGGDNVYI